MKKSICIVRASDITFISRIHRTALALEESGKYNVSVLSIMPRSSVISTDYPYKMIFVSIKSRVIKGSFFSLIRVIEGLVKLYFNAAKEKANIYIPIGIEDLIIVYIISKFFSIKYIYSANELEGDRKRIKNRKINNFLNRMVIRAEKLMLRNADSVIAADYERAKVMEKWYGIEHVETIRNVPIYEDILKKNIIREKLGISQESKILLYQGMLSPGRGLEASIKSCAISESRCIIQLVFLGFITDEYKNTLLKIADEYKFNNFHILPAVPWEELLFWTVSADISLVLIENVSISYYLAAPNKLYETIMAGVPYIASNFPEIKHVHEVSKSGVLVNPEKIDKISKAIDRLVQDETFYNNCIKATISARNIFNWNLEKKKLLNLLNKINLS